MKYRPEIDGMRALAVGVVVLYHAGFGFFSGGFVGVDIFFVISGFLITSIIWREMGKNEFSLLTFYERRCRRILPPLIFMALMTTIAAFFIVMIASDLADYGRSLVAVATFWSNIFFYLHSGYWAPDVARNPMLHTWSLAVEEQFYVLFPLLLLFLYFKARNRIRLVLGTMAALSLIIGTWMLPGSPEAVFYLLPFRAWELLLGSMLVFWPACPRLNQRLADALSLLGLALMITPALFYAQNQPPFPGLSALPPCLGAAMFIYIQGSNSAVSRVAKVFSASPAVGLGKISYALYLWHWPLFTLYHIKYNAAPNPTAAAGLIAAAVALSIFSYYFIEQPVRRKKILRRPAAAFTVLAALMALVIAAGLTGYLSGGFPQRLEERVKKYQDTLTIGVRGDFDFFKTENPHYVPDPSAAAAPVFMLWGDSTAVSWGPEVESLAKKYGLSGVFWFQTACRPLADPQAAKDARYLFNAVCHQTNPEIFQLIRDKKIKHVLITALYMEDLTIAANALSKNGPPLAPDDSPDIDERRRQLLQQAGEIEAPYLVLLVNELQELGATVWLIEEPPMYFWDLRGQLVNAVQENRPFSGLGFTRQQYEARAKPMWNMFEAAAAQGARLVRLQPEICPAGSNCLIADDHGSFYWDRRHLSVYGTEHFSETFESIFRIIKAEREGP